MKLVLDTTRGDADILRYKLKGYGRRVIRELLAHKGIEYTDKQLKAHMTTLEAQLWRQGV